MDAVAPASIALGAFSATVDLLHACIKTYDAWKSFGELDKDLTLLRNDLTVQGAILAQWRRDWYSFSSRGPTSTGRMRLLKQNDAAVQACLNSILILMKDLKPLSEIPA